MVKKIIEKHKDVKIEASETPVRLTIHKMVVPKEERGKGKGTQVLKDFIRYANETKKNIGLTPSSDFGGNVARLKKFYKKHGFRENKGKKRDFSTTESFVYEPEQ